MIHALTIAGTDPTGAAGIQVDLAVFHDFGLHGLSVVTAVVAQNTTDVASFDAVSADMVERQFTALVDDQIPIQAVKIGMLPNADVISAVARGLAQLEDVPIVIDPVLTSGSGRVDLADTNHAALLSLLQMADVVTPNIPEARALCPGARDLPTLARALYEMTGTAVLLKVGHEQGDSPLQDIWCDATGERRLEPLARIEQDVRGTGCQLSSAIAAGMALGKSKLESVESARTYLNALLRSNTAQIGNGRFIVIRPNGKHG